MSTRKPMMRTLMLVGMAAVATSITGLATPASAVEATSIVGGVIYSLDSNGSAYASGFDETLAASASIACSVSISGRSYPVTAVGDYAFDGSLLTSVTLCPSLKTIGDLAFSNSPLTTVAIPDSVTKIGQGAFFNDVELASVSFGHALTHIGPVAFGLTAIEHLSFPDSVKVIGDYAFYANDALVDASFGPSIQVIGTWAFAQSGLAQATFAGAVPLLGEDSFYQAPATLTFAVMRDLRLSPTPSIAGSRVVNQTLSATTGDWDSGVQLDYQWFRDLSAIDGATGADYRITIADLGAKLSVSVTGSKTGYVSSTRFSGKTVAIVPATQVSTPTPMITGSSRVGSVLLANSGSWDSGVALTYQWKRGRVSIAGATSSSYLLTAQDLGNALTVVVTGRKTGTVTASRTSAATPSIALGSLASTPTPTLSGTAVVGATLTSSAGIWDSGVSLSYQFKRAGTAIPGATSSSYALTAADLASQISVTVTARKTGFGTVVVSSAPSFAVESGNQTLTPTPTLIGQATVGQRLTVSAGSWDSGARQAYQWLRSGQSISGANSATYALVAADLGEQISVTVTSTRAGYNPATKSSLATDVVAAGTFVMTPTPKLKGNTTVGGSLTATPGSWESGVSLSYQWQRDGTPIAGATSRVYELVGADYSAAISVKVTGSRAGYLTAARESIATTPIKAGRLSLQPTPTIVGSATVGNTLLAATGTWDSAVQLTYQWKRSGLAISGATAATYTVTSADRGATVTVSVTATSPGFATVVKTSRSVRVVGSK